MSTINQVMISILKQNLDFKTRFLVKFFKHTSNTHKDPGVDQRKKRTFETDVQLDLGLLVYQRLRLNKKCQLHKQKALVAMFQMKRNLSKDCHLKIKLIAFKSYIVPIAMFCFHVWMPSRTDMRCQDYTAIKWILVGSKIYKVK